MKKVKMNAMEKEIVSVISFMDEEESFAWK